ncbi:protein containing DUF217 [mine drainage metagenome]|uniref:Protein containing DUF217 n=1 Tax=mine drainage metagenome TaxID=410659 RepID=T0ZGI7_9ZZZZ
MKTIMIEDKVYKKLRSMKGSQSFSKLLDSLVGESGIRRKTALARYFGVIKDKEADEWEYAIKEFRKGFRVRT